MSRYDDFWDRFVDRHWERNPGVARSFSDVAPMVPTPDDILHNLRLLHERSKTRRPTVEYNVTMEEDVYRLAWPRPEYFPTAEDKTLEGFHDRISKVFGDKLYGIILSMELTARQLSEARGFFKGLFDRIGLSGTRMRIVAFVGNYERGYFGVHKDGEASFQFPIIGEKRMRTWPEEFVNKTPVLKNALNYTRYIDQSTLVAGDPGDMLHWPATHWHCNEKVSGFQVAVTFFVSIRPSAVERAFSQEIERVVMSKADTVFLSTKDIPKSAATAGRYLDHGIRRLANSLNDPDTKVRMFSNYLENLTSYTLPLPHHERDLQVDANQTICCLADDIVAWTSLQGNRWCIAAGGRSFVLEQSSPRIPELLSFLNSGDVIPAGSVCSRFSDETLSEGEILEILGILAQFGGIAIVDSPLNE